jgi:hypothetical protein
MADSRDLPEGSSPRNWDVNFSVGSVWTREGLVSVYSYATTLLITGVSLVYGTATFTYVGPEPTINEGFFLSGFTGVLTFLNGLEVFVESVGLGTFTALVSGSDVTQYNITGYAVSSTGQFIGPNQGTIATSSTWVNPLNIFSATAYASATTGGSLADAIYPPTAANLSSSNPAWANPSNAVAVGAALASVSLSIGGAPPPPPPPPPSGIVPVQMNIGGYGSNANGSAGSSAVGYNNITTAGNLLICVVWAASSPAVSGFPPTINTPLTSGFTWVLAGSAQYSDIGTPQYGSIAVYYIANAASMPTATKTTVSAAGGLHNLTQVEFALYEFSGVATASVIDTSATSNDGFNSIPSTAALVTSVTDLIFVSTVCEGAAPSLGSGYTSGIKSSHISSGLSQYIANQAAGTIATGFGSIDNYWGCVAIAFKA